ncbi:DNA polymerase III subunit gamma/tau [Anaerofilum sp. BX8]|uniref:DNA-directed DNA polymerase n=1 Tax=Anaerofilum hominis TaxID=2763016 RepID=A0A923L0B3_9FIRM|nr:DNA polymerase III subunit gamma/tau [Anaerofilum hominis]MBC5580160.1 DNA polymerase III subunit gamma/tau [Anaerofilum hominis]
MYHALYRKYRPKTFGDVFGQDAITAALKNQIEKGRVGHAYIFTGTRGTGKTTCAKIFAKAVNCLSPRGGEPCGECDICRGLEEGSILDVVEIDAASNTGIDDIRALRDEAVYTPANCKYKVYIIDEVHMLSNSAFNALLKIMEEPPSHVIFILATTEIQKVPATVLSRCQRYDFGRIRQETIQKRLEMVAEKEGITLSPDAAALIAQLADGALRDGLSILDTCASAEKTVDEALVRRMAGVTDKSYLFSFSQAITAGDATRAIGLVASLRESSIDMKRLCEELIAHYRTIMLLGAGAGELGLSLSAADRERYRAEAGQVPLAAAVTAMRGLGDCLDRMGRGTDPRIELELALFTLCGVPAASPVTEKSVPAPAAPPQSAREEPSAVPPAPPPRPAPGEGAQAAAAQPCAFWPQVIALSEQSDPMVHGFLVGSSAYLQGRRVLIDGSALFLKFMKTNKDSSERLKGLIAQVTGERYSIGPYQKQTAAEEPAPSRAEETFQQLQDAGVPVEYR